jgi:hypothetical protein
VQRPSGVFGRGACGDETERGKDQRQLCGRCYIVRWINDVVFPPPGHATQVKGVIRADALKGPRRQLTEVFIPILARAWHARQPADASRKPGGLLQG